MPFMSFWLTWSFTPQKRRPTEATHHHVAAIEMCPEAEVDANRQHRVVF